MSDAELQSWVEAALGWCDGADEIALRHFGRDIERQLKPDGTYVTMADRAIETLVRRRIADAYPSHGVIGEELGVAAGPSGVRWYVDPIDATHNYVRGIPAFATLLAVERDGELGAGVISAPALGRRWYAWRGGGAWTTGGVATSRAGSGESPRRIEVSGISSLADAQILYSSPAAVEASGRAPGFRALVADAWRERGFGDFWGYTLVAEGAAEAMIEVGLSAWDAAAPLVLVEEAGGLATAFDGRRSIEDGTFVATNGRLHDEVLRRLAGPSGA